MSRARTRPGTRLATFALAMALPFAVASAWQAAASFNLIDPTQWASPVLVGHALSQQLSDPQFWSDFSASLLRDAQGTGVGILLGLPAGLALGRSALVRGLFVPVLDATKAIPIFTWVPLLSVWVGSGEEGKVTFIALAAALPVVFSTLEGVFSIQPRYLELARLLCLGRLVTLRRVVLPGAMPGILRGVHLALLYGWLATIGAEYLFEAGGGIGSNIMGARELYRLDLVVVDMIAIGLVGVLLDLAAGNTERFLLRWQERALS